MLDLLVASRASHIIRPRWITGSLVLHAMALAPARESVASAVFRPARLGPYPVRQLTKQPVRFITSQ